MDRPRRRVLRPLLIALTVVVVIAGLATWRIGLEEPDIDEPAVAEEPTLLGVEPVVLQEDPDEGATVSIPVSDGKQTSVDPTGPCAGVSGEAAKRLVARPDPVQLLKTTGGFTIYNCSPDPIAWTAHTVLWVDLAAAAGVVGGWGTHLLTFAVDTSGLPTGPYSFKVKVSQPGYNTYVEVKGTKLGGFAIPQPTPTIGGLTNGAPTGCAAQCITKAWLTSRPGTADVSLEVKTTTLALIGATVDTAAPKYSITGKPSFASPDITATSGGNRTRWTTVLKPLKAGTTYHIIVAAKDSKGAISYQVGTFKTVKVITGLANAEPGGCSQNCVKTAVLTPKPGTASVELSVEAHVPVKMAVYANGASIASTQGAYRTQWSTTLALKYDTDYEIRLEVTDEQGHRQTHHADVATPPDPAAGQNDVAINIVSIHVSNDADNQPLNWRGELRFRVEVNGQRQPSLDVGERKVNAPETIGVNKSVVIANAPAVISIRVQGLERDNNQRGFCAAGSPVFPEKSGRKTIDGCYDLEWNTAEITIDLNAPTGGALPSCFGLDVVANRCLSFAAEGEDPTFVVNLVIVVQ